MRSLLAPIAAAMILSPALAQPSDPKWTLELDSVFTNQNLNDVRVRGDNGTKFSMNNLTGKGTFRSARFQATYEGSSGTGYRFLYAPFRISGNGFLNGATNFKGVTFGTSDPVNGIYQFNSYRLTWRNRWKQGPNSDWRIGATLKVRDAEIRLATLSQAAEDTNIGLVPLLHIYGEEKISDRLTFIFDMDGLAAPQGRAFDIGLSLAYQLDDIQSVVLGYRTLEGGVDNERVFNFFWGNSLTVGYRARF